MSAIPCHVAFIMDGNGRWAVKRGLSRLKGHREGIKKAELVIDYCLRRGIKVVSLFVFSTENWKRAEREVAGLFKLASRYLDNIADFSKRGIRVVVSGDLSRLPEELVLKINKAETATVSNRVMTLNQLRRPRGACARGKRDYPQRKKLGFGKGIGRIYVSESAGPRPHCADGRTDASEQFSFVSIRLFRAGVQRYALAGHRRKGA